ncbi:MAG: SPOR domain-containing protein [Sphingobium sp.]
MKHIWGAVAGAAALAMASPVLADVKAGVDAWQQGDYARAIGEWRPLALAGDADAQFNMGQAYKLGRGVQPDAATALDWYRRAAVQGHLRAEDNLGLAMFQQGDRANAMPYLERAARRGEPRAQYLVGTALFNGDLLSKDWVRAYALMTRAAGSGLPQATTSLEQMDKYLPEKQRREGLALASTMERDQKAALASAGTAPVTPPSSRPVAPPVRVAERPAPAPAQPVVTRTPEPVAPARTQPAPARPARAAVAESAVPPRSAGGAWRVQLGAFGEDGRAKALWSSLSGKVKGLSAYQPYLVKSGAVTRLQAGPIASAADASRLCGAIKAAGADCMPKKM